MFRLFLVIISFLILTSCEDTNVAVMTDAVQDAVKAITLSDKQIQTLASHAASQSDKKHKVADWRNPYGRRLEKLTKNHGNHDGITFNFKVYLTRRVNAFAMADGSIRIYSGLMDIMSDKEILFVLGHEMGHVVHKHSRKKVLLAYASSAVRKGLASQNNEVGQIAQSMVGAFAEKLANAQFSQHEEKEADDYGVAFLKSEGYSKEPALSALHKLDELGRLQHTFLSSHPDPKSRADRLRDTTTKQPKPAEGQKSLYATVIDHFTNLVIFLWNWLQGLLELIGIAIQHKI